MASVSFVVLVAFQGLGEYTWSLVVLIEIVAICERKSKKMPSKKNSVCHVLKNLVDVYTESSRLERYRYKS